jgi:hypothetical protein
MTTTSLQGYVHCDRFAHKIASSRLRALPPGAAYNAEDDVVGLIKAQNRARAAAAAAATARLHKH